MSLRTGLIKFSFLSELVFKPEPGESVDVDRKVYQAPRLSAHESGKDAALALHPICLRL